MRVSKTFHDALHSYAINEMAEAFQKSENDELPTKIRYEATVACDFWRKLSQEERDLSRSFDIEKKDTLKFKVVNEG